MLTLQFLVTLPSITFPNSKAKSVRLDPRLKFSVRMSNEKTVLMSMNAHLVINDLISTCNCIKFCLKSTGASTYHKSLSLPFLSKVLMKEILAHIYFSFFIIPLELSLFFRHLSFLSIKV